MKLLGQLGWPKQNTIDRGQYTHAEGEDGDQEPFVSKESTESEIREQHQALLQSYQRLKHWVRVLSVVGTLVCVALVVALWNARRWTDDALIPSPVPSMPRNKVRFEQNETFAGPSTPENDMAWTAMMPAGDGFIIVNDPDTYNLPPGKPTKHGSVYDISLFHQLHCLKHIRNHYYLSKASLTSNNTDAIQTMLLRPQEDHVHHCFDYLRQGLMCAGDLTLEWPREEADGSRFAVDGWGITHECKSWDAIMEFMDENDVASRIWTA